MRMHILVFFRVSLGLWFCLKLSTCINTGLKPRGEKKVFRRYYYDWLCRKCGFFVSLYKGRSCKTSDKSVGLTLWGSWTVFCWIPRSVILKSSIQNNYRLVGLSHDPVRVLFKGRDSSYSKGLIAAYPRIIGGSSMNTGAVLYWFSKCEINPTNLWNILHRMSS